MSSQIQEFVQMISTQVGIISDDNLRKNNEKLISDFKNSQPDLFVQLLLQCLDPKNYDNMIRIYAITALRKNLSDHSESSFTNIYPKLSQETQNLLKTQLFVALEGESAQNTRIMIADAIGEIGASLLAPIGKELNPNAWSELIPTIWKLFQEERNTMIQAGFKILCTMLLYVDELFEQYRKDLKTLFINGLNNSDTATKSTCMEAIGAFIGTIEPKLLGDYYDLVPVVFQNLLVVSKQNEDDCERMLEVIADLCEEEPKWYKQNFQLVFNTLKEIYYNKSIELSSIKRVAIEIPILIVERYPGQIKNNDQIKKDLIEMIFMYMIDIDEDIDEKWMKPAEGFRENFTEDGDNADTQFGMSSIDRLMESVGQNHLMAILSTLIQNLLQNNDWRYPFSALMALSQIGTYMEDVSDLVSIMPVIMNFLSHQNAKVRYATYHAIGQISDDLKPDFQAKFHDQLYPLMVKGLDDPVPRVQSHCLASMTNYMEGVTQEQIKPYLQATLQKSFVLLQNGISLIKENALCNISACAEAAESDFHAYYKEALPIIFQVFQNHQGQQYKQLRGCVIEAISVIGESIDKELFIPYLNDTVQLILKIQENDLEQVDPQKNFVLTGWSRICQKYSQEFLQYLPQVVPSVLKVIQQIIDHSAKLEDDLADDPQYTQTHSFQHREAETAMNTIELFIENIGVDLGPYIQQFTELILPLCHYKGDSNIRSQASKCLPGLIACVVGTDRALAVRLTKEFIAFMYGAAENEFEAETITVHIQSMKSCIEVVGEFMGQEELNQLSQKILGLLIQSDKRKTGNLELSKAPDAEEEDVAIYDLDNTCEEKLHVAIAELLGVLFKTHADLCGELSEIMYNKFLPQVLSDSVSERMHQFGIFLIDDFIEFLQYKRVPDKWPHFCEALIKYACEKDCAVRQATVYGIGIFAEQTPASEFGKYAEPLIKCIGQSIQVKQQENQTQKTYTHCLDNTVAALGKLLKAQWQQVPQLNDVVNFWLSQLPLKKDKGEAYIQHQFLCDLVLNDQTQSTLFNDQNNYKTVTHLLVKLIESKVVTPEITESIKKALVKISQIDLVKNNWNQIIEGLDENNREKLQKIFQ